MHFALVWLFEVLDGEVGGFILPTKKGSSAEVEVIVPVLPERLDVFPNVVTASNQYLVGWKKFKSGLSVKFTLISLDYYAFLRPHLREAALCLPRGLVIVFKLWRATAGDWLMECLLSLKSALEAICSTILLGLNEQSNLT